MTDFQKRENLQKRYHKEISAGNFEKADEIMKQLVELDVKMIKKIIG